MKLRSDSIADGQPIDPKYAFAKQHPETHVELSSNLSPHLAWEDAPAGTRSFAIVCSDPDVPSVGDKVNKEGMTVPADLARVDFYHWVLVDLPPDATSVAEGEFSTGVTARGKDGPPAPRGARQGTNSYTQWFEGDADMSGSYYGYDGPCPPWNDELLHHYHFTVYALDVDRLGVEGEFDAPAALAAMAKHVLAKASVVGTYTLNPAVSPG